MFPGFARGDWLVADVPNVTQHLLLQLACSRLGVAFATCKDAAALSSVADRVHGVVSGSASSYLHAALAAKTVALKGSFAATLEVDGASAGAWQSLDSLAIDGDALPDRERLPELRFDVPLAFYGATGANAAALTNGGALALGAAAAAALEMTAADSVCVSVTLGHAFGVGTACAAAFLSGAAIVLPAVGGTRGCGVPSQRAAATLTTLRDHQCSLLIADTHTLEALHQLPSSQSTPVLSLPRLRGGICKTGSGSDFLDRAPPLEYAGARLLVMGKRPAL